MVWLEIFAELPHSESLFTFSIMSQTTSCSKFFGVDAAGLLFNVLVFQEVQ